MFSKSGLIAVPILVFFALCGCSDDSGYRYHSKVLSRAEAREVFDDFERILKDPVSRELSKTDAGAEFGQLVSKGRANRESWDFALYEVMSDLTLSVKALANHQSRMTSLRNIDDFENTIRLYFPARKEWQTKLRAFCFALKGAPVTAAPNIEVQLSAYEAASNAMAESLRNLIRFVDRVEPEYDAINEKLLFDDSNDLGRYQKLVKLAAATAQRVKLAESNAEGSFVNQMDADIEKLGIDRG